MAKCVSLPPRSSHSIIYFPEVSEGVGVASWSTLTEEQFVERYDADPYRVVEDLFDAIDFIDDNQTDPISATEYMAQLVYIHYCLVNLIQNPEEIFNSYSLLKHVLHAGYLSAYLSLLKDVNLTQHQASLIASETSAVRHAVDALKGKLGSNSLYEAIASAHPNTIVSKLANKLITVTDSEGIECKLPQRFRQQLIDLDEEALPAVSMNSAATLEDICVCINNTVRHLDRLQLHD